MSENSLAGTKDAASSSARRPWRRDLSPFDRLVKAPLGLIWLGVIALVAVPAVVTMTILYYSVRAIDRLGVGRRA